MRIKLDLLNVSSKPLLRVDTGNLSETCGMSNAENKCLSVGYQLIHTVRWRTSSNGTKEFTGARWFIEGDIKGCFDNINHAVLVEIINQKIKDARFLKLIRSFLKAGYMEDWKYHETYSGCPQGGIISPILANIYLNELDRHVMKIKKSSAFSDFTISQPLS